MRLSSLAALLVACAVIMAGIPALAADLTNGDFENWPSGTVAPSWTAYSVAGSITYTKQTTTVHGGLNAQGIKTPTTNGTEGGIRQTIDANIGDAFTFIAYAYPISASQYTRVGLGANWNGATTTPPTWMVDPAVYIPTRNAWNKLQGSGVATATSVTLFLDVKRSTNSGDTTTYWDDVVEYRAFVPAAPVLTNPTASSFTIDVDPGSNSGNANAQYALSIGGGAYVAGSNWLQSDGSVSTTPFWQSDADWGAMPVSGLAPATYTLQTACRYSSAYTQATSLGAGATNYIPEPSSIVALACGLPVLGMVIRRRKA